MCCSMVSASVVATSRAVALVVPVEDVVFGVIITGGVNIISTFEEEENRSSRSPGLKDKTISFHSNTKGKGSCWNSLSDSADRSAGTIHIESGLTGSHASVGVV